MLIMFYLYNSIYRIKDKNIILSQPMRGVNGLLHF